MNDLRFRDSAEDFTLYLIAGMAVGLGIGLGTAKILGWL